MAKLIINWTTPELPQSIKIGPFDFALLPYAQLHAAVDRNFGKFDPVQFQIHVDPAVHPFKVADTLLHEIGHAIYWAYGFDDSDKEERLVGSFATAWAAVYRDNPWLLPWLQSVFHPEPCKE